MSLYLYLWSFKKTCCVYPAVTSACKVADHVNICFALVILQHRFFPNYSLRPLEFQYLCKGHHLPTTWALGNDHKDPSFSCNLFLWLIEFPTSRLEMSAVADIFDRDGDGYIDYYEFVAALHPNKDAYKPLTDADKIEDEVLLLSTPIPYLMTSILYCNFMLNL